MQRRRVGAGGRRAASGSGVDPVSLDYDERLRLEVAVWRDSEPDFITRLTARATHPLERPLRLVVPPAAVAAALRGADAAAARLADRRSVRRHAGVEAVEDLADQPLQECDRLAARVRWRASLLGASSGAAFGFFGAAGLLADIPTLLLQAFRVIHRTAFCYGEVLDAAPGRDRALALFALASANSLEEKHEALGVFETGSQADPEALRARLERSAGREATKGAASLTLDRVARQFGVHLGLRKAAESLPVAGALVGGAVNAWYLADLAHNVQRALQAERLALTPPTVSDTN
jgi:hypothetical protein